MKQSNETPKRANLTYLCTLSDIPLPGCKEFDTDGTSIFVVNSHEGIYAYINRCPHQGTPLNWIPDQFFDSEKELIQCANHGALFDIASGRCVYGPCADRALEPARIEIVGNTLYLSCKSA